MPRPSTPFLLSERDREKLEFWVASRHTPERVRLRCRIILAAAEGHSNNSIAQSLNVTRPTVILWRNRFLNGGPKTLLDQGHEEWGMRITTPAVRRVLESMDPPFSKSFTIRELAQSTGLSPATIQRVWASNGIKPNPFRNFPLAWDVKSQERLSDIVGAYFHPPYHALVLVDCPASIEARAANPSAPQGNFFFMLRTLDALRASEGFFTHVASHFLHFLQMVEAALPQGTSLNLVVDLGNTKEDTGLARFLSARPCLRLIPLPDGVSWGDLMRGWFQPLVARGLANGHLPHYKELEQALSNFLAENHPDPFIWLPSPSPKTSMTPPRTASPPDLG